MHKRKDLRKLTILGIIACFVAILLVAPTLAIAADVGLTVPNTNLAVVANSAQDQIVVTPDQWTGYREVTDEGITPKDGLVALPDPANDYLSARRANWPYSSPASAPAPLEVLYHQSVDRTDPMALTAIIT